MVADDGRVFYTHGLEAERPHLEDGAVFRRVAGQHPRDLVYYGLDRDDPADWLFPASVCTQMGAEVRLSRLCRDYPRAVLLPDVLPEIYRKFGTCGTFY